MELKILLSRNISIRIRQTVTRKHSHGISSSKENQNNNKKQVMEYTRRKYNEPKIAKAKYLFPD